MQVTLPDGTVVLAQGRLDLVPSERPRDPDFALYLDQRWTDDPSVTWSHRLIEWPDFGLPLDEAAVFAAIADFHRRARAGQLVEVACYGGVGRTGTVLGCLTVLSGVPPSEVVQWVRSNYHTAAIETAGQEAFIGRFAQWLPGRHEGRTSQFDGRPSSGGIGFPDQAPPFPLGPSRS